MISRPLEWRRVDSIWVSRASGRKQCGAPETANGDEMDRATRGAARSGPSWVAPERAGSGRSGPSWLERAELERRAGAARSELLQRVSLH